MATKLSADAIGRALDHICVFGDTDVFPHLCEIAFLKEERSSIIVELENLDLDSFAPAQSVESLAPKSRYGFRIVHQMQMLETVLFTAAVIEIADEIEKSKIPIGEHGPFAYRFDS